MSRRGRGRLILALLGLGLTVGGVLLVAFSTRGFSATTSASSPLALNILPPAGGLLVAGGIVVLLVAHKMK